MKKLLGGIGLAATVIVGVGVALPTHATGGTITCNMLQNVISMADDGERIVLGGDTVCETSINIPTGSNIYLDLGENGISSSDAATITVAEGATLYLAGHAENTGSSGTVIENHGRIYVGDWQQSGVSTAFVSTKGDYSVNNYGEFNVASSNVAITGDIQNNEGTIRLAGGTYSDLAAANSYMTDGCTLTENASVSQYGYGHVLTCPEVEVSWNSSINNVLTAMPVGYSYTVTYNYPEIAEARGYYVKSYEPEVIGISGSALSGFTISALKAGYPGIAEGYFAGEGVGGVKVYDIKMDGKSVLPNSAIANQLTSYPAYDGITAASIEGNTLSATIRINKFSDSDIDISEDKEVIAALGNGTIIGYYDVEYLIMDGDNPIVNIISLGNSSAVVDLELPEDIPAIPDGYTRNYYVVHKHCIPETGACKVSTLPASINGETATVTSSEFSLFILAYTDSKTKTEAEAIEEDSGSATTPETGALTNESRDSSSLAILGSLTTGILASFLLFPKVKKIVNRKKA
ncbi:hypothetical protein IKG64_01380 [Candidatus Saccharibacteria bacterium]|nr:hypothetical protein [Candidatus Saccharibacteria bacterium]